MLEIVSRAIYLFLSLNNAAALRWESFEGRNRRAPLITTEFPLFLGSCCLFSIPSHFFSLPFTILLSFCSSSYHAHPFHDYTPFSVATFHFDFPKFPARCQMLSYWIVRTFFSLTPFFLRGSSFARFLSLRKFASTAR